MQRIDLSWNAFGADGVALLRAAAKKDIKLNLAHNLGTVRYVLSVTGVCSFELVCVLDFS